MNNNKIYGIIAEWKCQEPLIIEGELMTSNEAEQKMRELRENPPSYQDGNL